MTTTDYQTFQTRLAEYIPRRGKGALGLLLHRKTDFHAWHVHMLRLSSKQPRRYVLCGQEGERGRVDYPFMLAYRGERMLCPGCARRLEKLLQGLSTFDIDRDHQRGWAAWRETHHPAQPITTEKQVRHWACILASHRVVSVVEQGLPWWKFTCESVGVYISTYGLVRVVGFQNGDIRHEVIRSRPSLRKLRNMIAAVESFL